jgi:hypothetical protein
MGMLFKVDFLMIESEDFGNFYVLAYNYEHAIEETYKYLEKILGNKFEVLSIRFKPKINIVNAMNELPDEKYSGDCSDPYEVGETCDPSMLLKFVCPQCGVELSVADNGWTMVSCKECNYKFYRNQLILTDGIWVYTPEDKK